MTPAEIDTLVAAIGARIERGNEGETWVELARRCLDQAGLSREEQCRIDGELYRSGWLPEWRGAPSVRAAVHEAARATGDPGRLPAPPALPREARATVAPGNGARAATGDVERCEWTERAGRSHCVTHSGHRALAGGGVCSAARARWYGR